jgi:hypothetical protein
VRQFQFFPNERQACGSDIGIPTLIAELKWRQSWRRNSQNRPRNRAAEKCDELASPHCAPPSLRTEHRGESHQRHCIKLLLSDQYMSALGQKRTFAVQNGMSALPPKADIRDYGWDVRYGPIADVKDAEAPTFRLGLRVRLRCKGANQNSATVG